MKSTDESVARIEYPLTKVKSVVNGATFELIAASNGITEVKNLTCGKEVIELTPRCQVNNVHLLGLESIGDRGERETG